MNYTEMLFNRDERLVNLLNQADSKNLELIEEINNREDEIERLNNIINELEEDINERIKRYNVDETINGIVVGTLKYVLDKLQELKENKQ